MERTDMRKMMYLPPKKMLNISEISRFFSNDFSARIIQRAAENMMSPWPASPNITANRKGKVAIVYTDGFTSLITFHLN